MHMLWLTSWDSLWRNLAYDTELNYLVSYFIHVQGGLWVSFVQWVCSMVILSFKAENKQWENLKYVPLDTKLSKV